jgi:O-antigen/teichoic acid export membrane protein
MYLIATQPMLILNGPLWPAYADADARNDRAFIRKTLVSAASVTLVYTASSVLLLAWGSAPLLRRWTGGAVAPPAEIVYALGVWTIVAAMANCFAMFLNGMGILKPQVIAVLVIIAIGVPLKFLVARALGIDAMIYIFSAFFVVTLVTLYGVLYRVPIEDHLGIGSLRADTK